MVVMMTRAILTYGAGETGVYILVDGKRTPPGLKIRCEGIVKGDSKSCSIAAASILAKVLSATYSPPRVLRQF